MQGDLFGPTVAAAASLLWGVVCPGGPGLAWSGAGAGADSVSQAANAIRQTGNTPRMLITLSQVC